MLSAACLFHRGIVQILGQRIGQVQHGRVSLFNRLGHRLETDGLQPGIDLGPE